MKGCHLFHSERLWEVRRDRLDLPSDRDARTFIAAKKAHQLSTRSRHVKHQNTCLQAIILITSRATCRQNKWCKSNLSTVSVLVKRSLHQVLMHSGRHGTMVPNVCLQALTLSLPSPRDIFTLSPNRGPVHRLKVKFYMKPSSTSLQSTNLETSFSSISGREGNFSRKLKLDVKIGQQMKIGNFWGVFD